MTQTYQTLKIERPQEHTVLVTLNRPEVANAMNTQMGLDLLAAFEPFHAVAQCAALHRHHRQRRTRLLRRRRPEGAQRHDGRSSGRTST